LKKGTIYIQDMEFRAYHGCFKEEKVVGNDFIVNLTLETDIEKPCETDSISDTINYQTVYLLVKEQMETSSDLLEHVCERVLNAIYHTFGDKILSAWVKVDKMNPPMGGKMKCVSVSLSK